MSNLHKETKKGFVEVMTDLRNYINPKTQAKALLARLRELVKASQ